MLRSFDFVLMLVTTNFGDEDDDGDDDGDEDNDDDHDYDHVDEDSFLRSLHT